MTHRSTAGALALVAFPRFDLDNEGKVYRIDADPRRKPWPLSSGRIGAILCGDRLLMIESGEVLTATWSRTSWAIRNGQRWQALQLLGPLPEDAPLEFVQRDFTGAPKADLHALNAAVLGGDGAAVRRLLDRQDPAV